MNDSQQSLSSLDRARSADEGSNEASEDGNLEAGTSASAQGLLLGSTLVEDIGPVVTYKRPTPNPPADDLPVGPPDFERPPDREPDVSNFDAQDVLLRPPCANDQLQQERNSLMATFVNVSLSSVEMHKKVAWAEKLRREEKRRDRVRNLEKTFSQLAEKDLYKSFETFVDSVDRAKETPLEAEKTIDKILAYTRELESRALLRDDVERYDAFSVGDPLYDAYLPVLSYRVGPEVAKALLMAHKTGKQNMYKSVDTMCWWLAGLGYVRFETDCGFEEGLEMLKDQIGFQEVQMMAALGQTLKVHGLKPVPLHVPEPLDAKDNDDPDGGEFRAGLLQMIQAWERENGKAARSNHDHRVQVMRKWAETEKLAQEMKESAQTVAARESFYRSSTNEVYDSFTKVLKEFKRNGRTEFGFATPIQLKEFFILLQELKMRLMYLLKYFGGEQLCRTECLRKMVYIPVLIIHLGPKAAMDLLTSNMVKETNIYENSHSMATWLLGLGYPRDESKTMPSSIQDLKQKLDSGEVEPLQALAPLLEDLELPWPPTTGD